MLFFASSNYIMLCYKDDLSNYRPISHLSKLTERVVNYVLRTIHLPTTSSILSSLPISNIILLKLLFSPFMTISSKLLSKSHLSHSSWLICCVWQYISFYSSWTSYILHWHFFYCSLLDQILFTQPFFLCQYRNSVSSVFQLLYGVP